MDKKMTSLFPLKPVRFQEAAQQQTAQICRNLVTDVKQIYPILDDCIVMAAWQFALVLSPSVCYSNLPEARMRTELASVQVGSNPGAKASLPNQSAQYIQHENSPQIQPARSSSSTRNTPVRGLKQQVIVLNREVEDLKGNFTDIVSQLSNDLRRHRVRESEMQNALEDRIAHLASDLEQAVLDNEEERRSLNESIHREISPGAHIGGYAFVRSSHLAEVDSQTATPARKAFLEYQAAQDGRSPSSALDSGNLLSDQDISLNSNGSRRLRFI